MNALSEFLINHPHCTKYMCSTCGGMWGFIFDLNKWIDQEKPDLVQLVLSTDINDLTGIQEWPVFLDMIINKIPEVERYKISFTPLVSIMITRLQERKELEHIHHVWLEEKKVEKIKKKETNQGALKARISQLVDSDPIDRLEIILKDNTFALEEYPIEWTRIPLDQFRKFYSVNLTRIINLLSQRRSNKKEHGRILGVTYID